ncbi:MAG: hypothetical protein H7836_09175 [Magnetococcus sp. YQC-3]
MFSISSPEMIYFYHQANRPAPRQVVEPSAGVRSQTTDRSAHDARRRAEGGGADFSSLFVQALNRNQA